MVMICMDYEDKELFVELDLAGTLHEATRGCVIGAYYRRRMCEEFVDVVYRNMPEAAPDVITVNVTGDSPWAVLKDVMKAVAFRFE